MLFILAICGAFNRALAGNNLNNGVKNDYIPQALQKKFYKIEVQTLDFLGKQQSEINGLIESYRGTSVYTYDLFSRDFCVGRGGVLDCQSFTYDGALAAMAFILAGKTDNARKMLNAYRKEFYKPKDDVLGLCNAYRTDKNDEDGLMVGIDGVKIHVGPMMWVSMAALHYTAVTDDLQYLGFIIETVKWARQQNHWDFPDGSKGGVSMGYGWGTDWSKVYSTENNIDYYAVLSMLNQLYFSGDSRVRNIFSKFGYGPGDIRTEIDGVERWFKEAAYSQKENAFYCGYNEKGADKTRALDNVSWMIDALGPQKLLDMDIDPFDLMEYAERRFLVINDVMGESVEGFDFTDPVGRRSTTRIIWFEGTGFQTVAYQVMARYAKKIGRKEKAEEYRLKALKFSNELDKASQLVNMSAGALPYTSKCLGEKEVMFAYCNEWELPRGHDGQWVASVSSTMWRYFVFCGFNPMSFNNSRVDYKIAKLNMNAIAKPSQE